MTDGRIVVAIIGAPHGVRGEVRVKAFTADPLALGDYGPLRTADGDRPLTVAGLRALKDDMLVVRFVGVTDRAGAEALRNARLYIERARLPPAEDEEFYHADLIGLMAQTAEGSELGRVVAIANYGAGDLLEIAPAQGETLLVPFAKAFVPVVDLAGGRLVVAEGAIGSPETAEE